MSRHALPRPVRGPFPVAVPGPDGAYIISSSSRSCDVLIELYGSGLCEHCSSREPRTIKDETPLRSHNLCMLRRWRRDWRSSNRRLSIASDLLSLFCPLLGTHTHTHTHISLPVAAKNQKKPKKTVEILLSDCGLSTVLQAHVVALDAASAAADQVGRPPADHSSTGVQKAAKERRGGRCFWNRKGTRPQNKFQV